MQQIIIVKSRWSRYPGINASLVRTGFQPDDLVFIKVRLVDSFGHCQEDDNAPMGNLNVLGLHNQRTMDQMASRIADKLINPPKSWRDSPGIEPSSATPIKIVPPSELAKAAIFEASESLFFTSSLNWRVLSSPREI